MLVNCYRCGDPGHFKRDCTFPADQLYPPGEPAESRPLDNRKDSLPVPPRRAPEEIADAEERAGEVRRLMGWHPDQRETRLRELAAAQAADSRRSRFAF